MTFGDDLHSMESLAGLGINKPTRAWIDSDIDRAFVRLTQLAQQFNQLEAVARVSGRKDKRAAMAMIVSIDGRPTPIVEEFDVLDTDFDKVNDLIRKIEKLLGQNAEETSRNIILAALAKVSAARMRQSVEGKKVDG